MLNKEAKRFSRHAGHRSRRAAGLLRTVARLVQIGDGENTGDLRREQARTLLASARLFPPIGLVTVALMAADLPVVRHNGAAPALLVTILYVAWVALARFRRRLDDIAFIAGSIAILFALGCSWGALVLRLTDAARRTGTDLVTPASVMMALMSAPMIIAPVLAALAFWVPMTVAAAIALFGLLDPIDSFTDTLFIGYATFTLAGISLTNFMLHERAVGRISLRRGADTINVLLGENRAGVAGGWSWETDEAGVLREPSAALGAAVGREPAALTGAGLTALLGRAAEPDGRNGELAAALAARAAFRELTVTVTAGGETRWWSLSGHPCLENGSFVGFRGVGVDITEQRQADARMVALATRDSLTGILNRQALLDGLEISCAAARTGAPGTSFALVLIDLDRFKDVNDRHGHAAGDELLKLIAARMRHTVRGEDRVARLGGDEFAITLARAGETEATEIIGRLQAAFADCVRHDPRMSAVGATFGVALCPRHGVEPAQLLRNADLALYDGKRRARGSLAVFRPELETAVETRQTMGDGLRAAMETGAVRLLWRPTARTGTGAVVSAEPVATWSTPGGAILSALSLFRLAAEAQLLAPLAHTILRRALEAAAGWDRPVRLTLNLPAPLLAVSALLDELARELDRAPISLGRIELAVRAGDLAGAPPSVAHQLNALQAGGARLVLDEFGTGVLDLSLFRRHRFDAIRLHGRLLRELPGEDAASGLLRWILTLARELGMDLVADGLANPEQLARLRGLGVDLARGRAVAALDGSGGAERLRRPGRDARSTVDGMAR